MKIQGAIVVAAIMLVVGANAGLLDDMGVGSSASKEASKYNCIPKPPPPRPAQHSSAEGMAPLPLPGVPLRRTEKKNPPRPPVLVAKIATGKKEDWATNPSDVDNLLRWMAKELKVNFSTTNIPANSVPANPVDVPILYRTGHLAFSFTPQMRQKLRAYVLAGGTVIFDACCGRREFAVSAMREMQALIPERPPARLSWDHPVYHSYYDIKNIRFRPAALKAGAQNDQPALIGVDVGCRTAIFFFRWDISCGWDNLADDKHHKCLGYELQTSKMLGANLMAYITSERNAAIPLSKALAYLDASREQAGKFVIAQAKYDGLWRTRDAGLSMLLNTFHEKTQAPVRFQRSEVEFSSPRLFDAPFVYMTGHQEFHLKTPEAENLRRYLMRGGVLLAEACCGRASFNRSFRREIGRVLSGSKLELLPREHLIYRFPNKITGLQPRPALARELGAKGAIPPHLLGININGSLGVIYSPVGLACGWELAQCPYCRGVQANDSLALGVNMLSYILTQ